MTSFESFAGWSGGLVGVVVALAVLYAVALATILHYLWRPADGDGGGGGSGSGGGGCLTVEARGGGGGEGGQRGAARASRGGFEEGEDVSQLVLHSCALALTFVLAPLAALAGTSVVAAAGGEQGDNETSGARYFVDWMWEVSVKVRAQRAGPPMCARVCAGACCLFPRVATWLCGDRECMTVWAVAAAGRTPVPQGSNVCLFLVLPFAWLFHEAGGRSTLRRLAEAQVLLMLMLLTVAIAFFTIESWCATTGAAGRRACSAVVCLMSLRVQQQQQCARN